MSNEATLYVVDGLGKGGQETVLTGKVQRDGDVLEAGPELRERIEKPVVHFDTDKLTDHQARVIRDLDLTPEQAQELGKDGLLGKDGVGPKTADAILAAITGGPRIVIPWLRHATDDERAAYLGDDTDQQDTTDSEE